MPINGSETPTWLFAGWGFLALLLLFTTVLMVASTWRVLQKGGQPGWGCLIPVYNLLLMTRLTGMAWWWVLLTFIPLVNIAAGIALGIVLPIRLGRCFGKGTAFGLGLIFFPIAFLPLLAFGACRYEPPA